MTKHQSLGFITNALTDSTYKKVKTSSPLLTKEIDRPSIKNPQSTSSLR